MEAYYEACLVKVEFEVVCFSVFFDGKGVLKVKKFKVCLGNFKVCLGKGEKLGIK